MVDPSTVRKPSWLKVAVPAAAEYRATRAVVDDLALHTVCDEARCPNKGECFAAGTATFLILGDACTRDCRFCSVRSATEGQEAALCDPDPGEPQRVAAAAARLGLTHVVVTSVMRDDLADDGAAHFAATVAALRTWSPAATVEVLVPDFGGDEAALSTVLEAQPDVFGHNLETVPRLYSRVRPQADYGRSLEVLRRAAAGRGAARPGAPPPAPLVKTGLMLGLGETDDEVDAVLDDCVAAGVDLVTAGQYLQPAPDCLPVARYVPPEEFAALEGRGGRRALRVVAAPLVRSSYRAGELLTARGDRIGA